MQAKTLAACAWLAATSTAFADDVGGTILSDTHWTVEGSPYFVMGDITIGNGATLTIEPGVEVRFLPGMQMKVGSMADGPGALVAIGDGEFPILFTSASEEPLPGDWRSIVFSAFAMDTVVGEVGEYLSGSTMQHCIVEFGGYEESPSISVAASSIYFSDCLVHWSAGTGLRSISVTDRVIVLNSIFEKCLAPNSNGGGLYVYGGVGHIVDSCTFVDNAAVSGGGMYASGDSMFESINGLLFVHNVANGFGGGMRAANVAVQNLTFTSNEAAIGGGLSLTVGPAGVPNVVSGCVFEDNAAALGGGAYVGIGAPTVVQDSSFIGNEAYGSGGGLYADGEFGELLVLTDLVFEGNSSENAGGGFFTSGTTEATDIFLTGNTALRGGGAHLTQAPSSVLTRVTAADNMVVAGGGGICFWVASDSIMQECTIMGNMAFEAGGGLIIGGTPGLTLVDTRIVDNVAVLEGGGFWDDSNGLDISGDLTVYNTIAGNHALKGSAVFHGAAFGGSLGDMSAEYTCWGTSKETLVAEGIWDHVDDASLAVVNAYPFVSCFYNCQADCDDNGTLDITDFLCFKSLFDAGDEGADTNGDGELNVLDFVFFQKMFVDGC